jgi:hypothetical protein
MVYNTNGATEQYRAIKYDISKLHECDEAPSAVDVVASKLTLLCSEYVTLASAMMIDHVKLN